MLYEVITQIRPTKEEDMTQTLRKTRAKSASADSASNVPAKAKTSAELTVSSPEKKALANLTTIPLMDSKEAAEVAFRKLDRTFHAMMGRAEGGLSPISLWLAWADWVSHLAMSPGKQAEMAWKYARKWQRLAAEVMCQMGGGKEGIPCVEPLKQDRRFSYNFV